MSADEPLDPPSYFSPDRRQVLRWLAFGAAGAASAGALASCTSGSDASPTTTTQPLHHTAAKVDIPVRKLLVIIELGGGNDGLSTLVPYTSDRYRSARPTLALGEGDVLDLGDGLGLNKHLAGLHQRGLAIVGGIGTTKPDLSHFEMLDRWWYGSPGGVSAKEKAALKPGFLGRLCDAIQGDEPFTGMSLKFGSAASLRAAKAATTGLPPVEGSFLDQWAEDRGAFADYLEQISAGSGRDQVGQAKVGVARILALADLIDQLAPPPTGYPDSDFGAQLALASRLIRSNTGVQVLHIPMGISVYDTHSKHGEVHPKLMADLGAGLSAFIDDLRAHHLQDKVLIATTSEFGRRVEEHSDGLDHGAASVAMLMGPVAPGIHGDPSPVDQLDDLGDLVATVTFDRYLATLAKFLDVEPSQVLGGKGKAPTPFAGLLA